MPSLVTSGATLRCSMGSATSTLIVPPGRGVVAGGNPVATVADRVALVNIQPFGLCASTANPGFFPRSRRSPPCAPAFPAPWMPGSASVKTGGLPLVNSGCQCQCQYGGMVSVVASGQQTTTVA